MPPNTLQQRQEELRRIEAEARAAQNRRVPQRRFGAGVTPQEQRDVLERKRQAAQVLRQVQAERARIQQSQRQQSQQAAVQRVRELVSKSRDRYGSGTISSRYLRRAREVYEKAGLSGSAGASLYATLVSGEGRRVQQETSFREQGIEPIFSDGKVVGFKDNVRNESTEVSSVAFKDYSTLRRYERAGVIRIDTRIAPTAREQGLSLSLPENERFKSPQSVQNYGRNQTQILLSNSSRVNQSSNNVSQSVQSEYSQLLSPNSGNSLSRNDSRRNFNNSNNLGNSNVNLGLVSEVKESKDPLVNLQRYFSKITSYKTTSPEPGSLNKFNQETKSFLGGLGQVAVGKILFLKRITTQSPVKTFEDISSSTGELFTKARTTGFPEVSQNLINRPGYSTGIAVGEYLSYKAPSVVLKTSDYARTFNLKNIKAENIIAPEFYQGQTYPAIRRGQTAGQLLKEFESSPRLSNQNRPGGFTAAPSPIKGTIVQRGSSELPGLYQAPRLSPQFLKIASEQKKLFGLNPFGTFRPTILRVTPTKFILGSGVKAGTKTPVSVNQALKEFEKPPKGASVVPFIKTEKEAVIPFGTELTKTNREFFINFEGRRVPIVEFETAGGRAAGSRTVTLREISRQYSYRPREQPIISPLTIPKVSVSRSVSSSRSSLPRSYRSLSGSSGISSRGISRFSGSSGSFRIPSSVFRGSSSGSLSSSGSSISGVPRTPNIRVPPINPRSPTPKRSRISQKDIETLTGGRSRGYRPFVIRRGKKVYLDVVLPKGKALRKAEREAKTSLRATFGVDPTNILVAGKDVRFTPNKKLFRDFRIKAGKKVPLRDTYIQRLGKRLSFKGETAEIQRYARRARI